MSEQVTVSAKISREDRETLETTVDKEQFANMSHLIRVVLHDYAEKKRSEKGEVSSARKL